MIKDHRYGVSAVHKDITRPSPQSIGARYGALTALAAVAAFYIILELHGVTCPIRFLTGVSCAGCGMSRAWLSLLRLDLAAAFRFHPLFWLPVPAAVLLLARRRIPRRVFRAGLVLCIALFLIVYLIRLFLPGQIVVFNPSEGLLWRLAVRLRDMWRLK